MVIVWLPGLGGAKRRAPGDGGDLLLRMEQLVGIALVPAIGRAGNVDV